MDKLKDINCYGKFHIDQVGGIRADLVKMEKKLAKFKLPKEAVSNWNERIPVTVTADGNKEDLKKLDVPSTPRAMESRYMYPL